MKKCGSFSILQWLLALLFSFAPDTYGQAPVSGPGDSLLQHLRKEHPRLIATGNDFKRIAAERNTDAYVRDAFQQLYRKGESILGEPVCTYTIPDGLRLLYTSRQVLERVSVLGFLYRTTGEERFAARAWQELSAAAAFPDWNPRHFLDVGEMTFAFAIGYDWLFDYFDKDRKNVVRSAIIEKGLSRALLAYNELATYDKRWWVNAPHNWNMVCNGGIGTGALAIADEEPGLCSFILKNVLKQLPQAMQHFAPDGAWSEGPLYWGYGTKYSVAIIASLESALGNDFGLSGISGFARTGLFPLYMTGPLSRSFNYADAVDEPIMNTQLFWFAKRFQQPQVAKFLYALKPADPFALLWYDPSLMRSADQLPPDAYFRTAEAAAIRSSWNDSNAVFVAFKAGDNKVTHSHLDEGSFVLDALGQRWILDLGPDDYNIPGYFSAGKNGQRWEYYRMRSEGHNTLVIQPGKWPDQDPESAGSIVAFNSKQDAAYGIMDLSAAYARSSVSVKRGIALASGRQIVVLEDEIHNKQPADIYWFAHTNADIRLSADKRSAILHQGGKTFAATLVYPAAAQFSIMDARPLPSSPHPQQNKPNTGTRKLSLHLQDVSQTRIVVIFHPVNAKIRTAFSRPLEEWGY